MTHRNTSRRRVGGWSLGLAVVLGLIVSAGPAGAKKPRPSPPPISEPALTFTAGGASNNVFIATADGSATEQLTKRLKGRSRWLKRRAPAWSPDGQRIAYLQDIEEDKVWKDLILMDADGENATTEYSFDSSTDINLVPGADYGLHWLPDATKILYSTGADIRALDLDGYVIQSLGLTRVKGNSVGPDLDPATGGFQGLVCYAAGSDRVPLLTRDIHVAVMTEADDGTLGIDADTITALEYSTENQDYPVFAPDCGQIAFKHVSWGGTLMIVDFDVLTLTFGDPVVLVSGMGEVGSRLTWSPDGAWISFGTPGGIYRIHPDGTELTYVVAGDGPNWNPAWPDSP